jgi:hypothetical protein
MMQISVDRFLHALTKDSTPRPLPCGDMLPIVRKKLLDMPQAMWEIRHFLVISGNAWSSCNCLKNSGNSFLYLIKIQGKCIQQEEKSESNLT